MTKRFAARARAVSWQFVFAILAFVQVVATFAGLTDRLYVVKWAAGVGIALLLFALGHFRISTGLAREFSLLMGILAIGLLSQLRAALDSRAVALAASYTLTATVAFLVAPSAFRRRSVQRIVWPGLLLGVAIATLWGEILGLRDPLRSILSEEGRLRYIGAFYLPNAAGTAGLIGVILAGAAFNATRRWLYLACAPPLIIVMILADSRGSLLAAVAFLVVPPIVAASRWQVQRLVLAACVAGLVILGFGLLHSGSLEWPDTSHTQATLNRVSTGRWANWVESLSYLDGPMQWTFGLGLSRNLSFVAPTTDFPVPVRGANADNIYVDLLGRTGISGLSCFLILATSLTLRIGRGLRRASPRRASDCAIGLAVLAATVALGLTNSGVLTWGWLHAIVAWPLVAGVATAPT